MKPTHVIKTLDGGKYYMELDDSEVADVMKILQLDGGLLRMRHLVKDESVYDKTTYHEKTAILTCRSIVAVEEL